MPRRHTLPSDEALYLIASYFAALSDPMRLKLVRTLMAGEQNVNTLVDSTGGVQSNVSRHLAKLTSSGLLHRRKEGAHVIYSIADDSIYDLCSQVCGILEKRLAKQARIVGIPHR